MNFRASPTKEWIHRIPTQATWKSPDHNEIKGHKEKGGNSFVSWANQLKSDQGVFPQTDYSEHVSVVHLLTFRFLIRKPLQSMRTSQLENPIEHIVICTVKPADEADHPRRIVSSALPLTGPQLKDSRRDGVRVTHRASARVLSWLVRHWIKVLLLSQVRAMLRALIDGLAYIHKLPSSKSWKQLILSWMASMTSLLMLIEGLTADRLWPSSWRTYLPIPLMRMSVQQLEPSMWLSQPPTLITLRTSVLERVNSNAG